MLEGQISLAPCRERPAEAQKLLEMVAKQTPPLNALIDAWRTTALPQFAVGCSVLHMDQSKKEAGLDIIDHK